MIVWARYRAPATLQEWERLHDFAVGMASYFAIGSGLHRLPLGTWTGTGVTVAVGFVWQKVLNRMHAHIGRTPATALPPPAVSGLCRARRHDVCGQVEAVRLRCACGCHKAYV